MNSLLSGLAVLITLLYPLAIWWGLGLVEPRWLAVLLLVTALCRVGKLRGSRLLWLWLGGAGALAAFTFWQNGDLPLKLYPVMVNAAMLVVFGYSLIRPPSLIERFVRFREPDLPPSAVRYMRTVTQVWCGFFVLNGCMALVTALWASQAAWSLYNGLISYVLMGLLFGIEYLVRVTVRRRAHG